MGKGKPPQGSAFPLLSQQAGAVDSVDDVDTVVFGCFWIELGEGNQKKTHELPPVN